VSDSTNASRSVGVPPPQHNLQSARDSALANLRGQTPEQLVWLGASEGDDGWQLKVIGDLFDVDLDSGLITCEGEDVGPWWHVLVLHYLAIRTQPETRQPEVTFATLPGGRTYAKVTDGRVNRRFCATVGRDQATLQAAAERIGARFVEGGDVAFDVDFFPRIPIRTIWHAADEEFPPSCTMLLPANIESFLCVEDIVVVSESLVSRLSEATSG
jgi:hypothetical protein